MSSLLEGDLAVGRMFFSEKSRNLGYFGGAGIGLSTINTVLTEFGGRLEIQNHSEMGACLHFISLTNKVAFESFNEKSEEIEAGYVASSVSPPLTIKPFTGNLTLPENKKALFQLLKENNKRFKVAQSEAANKRAAEGPASENEPPLKRQKP